VQVSKLLLSLPSPAAPPIAQLTPPPALPSQLDASRDACWTAGSAVDVSLRLPAEAASPSREATAARHDVMPRSGDTSGVSTAAEMLTHMAAAGKEPSPRGRVSQHIQPQRSVIRSIPPNERYGTSRISAEHAAGAPQGAKTEQVPLWRPSTSAGSAEQSSRARRHANKAPAQRPAQHVPAGLQPSGSWLARRLQPFRQPDTAAHGVATGADPPSPTFSAMERAASAAANVAARLFDTDVRPT